MKHLLSIWPYIAERAQDASQILLLSDFDGTLAPIVESPGLAELPESARQALTILSRQPGVTLGIVSGRSLPDLKQKIGIENIIYAGNHGLEIDGKDGYKFTKPEAAEFRPMMHLIYLALQKGLLGIPGVLIEDKGLSLSVHYRMVPPDQVWRVQETLEGLIGSAIHTDQVKLNHGKKVFEIKPAIPWHKGKAIQWLLQQYKQIYKKGPSLIIFLGDDQTDEDVFRFLGRHRQAVTVYVGGTGATGSTAMYYLRSPEEVGRFLDILLAAVRKGNNVQFN